jgi:DNA helicase II / ATP-dependent DNA helicase PcrA
MNESNVHPNFDDEQKKLKKTWEQSYKEYTSYKNQLGTISQKLSSANLRDMSDYGERPVLLKRANDLQASIRMIEGALDKLYFGKLEYTYLGEKKNIYIGENNFDFGDTMICSFKAPIANVFYSRGNSYKLLNGDVIKVKLHLVRTLDLEKDKLNEIYDNYVEDLGEQEHEISKYLQKQLDRLGEDRFKDIHITIQKEQNEIIRMPADKHLVIQGGAGTGKTIVLLYRLAYLMHNKGWHSEQVLLISPSSLFLHFLKKILPEADLEEVQQRSLYDVTQEVSVLIQKKEWLPAMIELEPSDRCIASDSAVFKGANAYKQLIDNRIDNAVKWYAKKINDFTYKIEGSVEIISQKEIRDWFLKDYSKYPIETRKQLVRERIKGQLSSLIDSSLSRRRGGENIFTPQEIESMLGSYFKDWPDSKALFKDFTTWYFKILTSFNIIGKTLGKAHTQVSSSACLWNTYFSMLSLNDLAIFFYVSQKIQGETKKYKHIVIDEAQLLNPIWLEAIKMLLDDGGTMTLTGDINQKPEMVDIYDWNDLADVIGGIEVKELSISYRLTDEIAKLALDLLYKYDIGNQLYTFESAGRTGPPIQELKGHFDGRIKELAELIVRSSEYNTFALITRTVEDAELVYEVITQHLEGIDIVSKFDSQLSNLSIIPISLVSGMEFDFVAIINYEAYDQEDEYEARALYIAVTRAVHQLILA